MKKIRFFTIMLTLVFMISFVSCGTFAEKPTGETEPATDAPSVTAIPIKTVASLVLQSATKGEPSETGSILPPGTNTPVEQLPKASDELLNQTKTLDLGGSDTVFSFTAKADGGVLTLLCSPSQAGNCVMLLLKTEYKTCREFVAAFDGAVSGKVIAVDVISALDYQYPLGAVSEAIEANASVNILQFTDEVTVCYGLCEKEGGIPMITDAMLDSGADTFRAVYDRFEVSP